MSFSSVPIDADPGGTHTFLNDPEPETPASAPPVDEESDQACSPQETICLSATVALDATCVDESEGYLHCDPTLTIAGASWSPVMLEGEMSWSVDATCQDESEEDSGGAHVPGLPSEATPGEASVAYDELLCQEYNWYEPGCISVSAAATIVLEAKNAAEVLGESVQLHFELEAYDDICQTANLRPYEPDAPTGPISVYVDQTYQYCVTGSDRDGDDIRFSMWVPGPDITSPYMPSGSTWCPSVTFTYQSSNICLLVYVTDIHGYDSSYSDCLLVDATFGTPENAEPRQPSIPEGPLELAAGQSGSFSTVVQDDDADQVTVTFDWGDGTTTDTPLVDSGTQVPREHGWTAAGAFCIRARGTDEHGAVGPWSDCATVEITIEPDAFEPDDSFGQHSDMGLAATPQAQERTLAPVGDEDFVKFYTQEGNRVHFFSTGNTDTHATLYDPSRSQVTFDDDSGEQQNFMISYLVETDGYHYIRIRGGSSDSVGTYVLHGQFDAPPVACFTHSIDGMKLTVDASCSSDVDDSPLTYHWDWGDGTTTDGGPQAVHVFENRGRLGYGIGRYAVSLEVTDDLGSHEESKSMAVGPSDYSLAKHYAPVFYHDTQYIEEPCSVDLDEITRFDFDGDWNGANNWEHADDAAFDHRAFVYYSVHETRSDYYIGYAVFHPRDWTSCSDLGGSLGEHENDMETVLVKVQKTDTQHGEFVATLTMAHNFLNTYWSASEQPSVQPGTLRQAHDSYDQATFWTGDGGKHIELGIETEGHGILHKRHPDIWDDATDSFQGGDGNVYFPTGVAEVPGDGPGDIRGNDDDVGYELIGIDEMWSKRYDYGNGQPFVSYGVFYGLDGLNHKAGAPWGIEDWCYEGDPFPDEDYCPESGPGGEVDRRESLWAEMPHVVLNQYLNGMPGPNSYEYVHRSVDGHFESFHEYRRNTAVYRWSHPGATSFILEFDNIQVSADAADALQYRVAPSGTWRTAPDAGGFGSECLYGDRAEIRLVSDGDSVRDWGFYLRNIQWDPSGC